MIGNYNKFILVYRKLKVGGKYTPYFFLKKSIDKHGKLW